MKAPEKRTTYSGRWLIKAVEAGLTIAILFFVVDALNDAFSQEEGFDSVVIETTGVISEINPVETNEVTTDANGDAVKVEVLVPIDLTASDYFGMGLDHHSRDEYDAAIMDYTHTLEADSTFASAWLNRGVAQEQLNNDAAATNDFFNWMTRDGVVFIEENELPIGDSTTVEMGEGLVYAIPLTIGRYEQVDIDAQAANGDDVDPIIVILDCNGIAQDSDDDIRSNDGSLISMDSRIESFHKHGANCRGDYTLLVSHAGGGSFGTLEITVELAD